MASSASSSGRQQRTHAEWVTLAVSFLVLAALVALILTRAGDGDRPAQPVARVESTRRVDEQWFVDVAVENRGGSTAADVQVIAELTADGHTVTAGQMIDFLAADERDGIVFVFDTDPAAGELTVRVSTFTIP